MPEEICKLCEGAGLRVVERSDGTRAAIPCECRVAKRSARMIQQARIPQRYAHCMLDNYDTDFPSSNRTLYAAFMKAHEFLEEYSSKTKGRGLLLVGKPGLGKTHLSVGLLRALIEKGAQGLFVDYRDLLKQVQNSYNPTVSTTELGILNPIFRAEVLVIDDLGASKPTDWVFDTVAHILNSRYNDELTTIITTNFPNRAERATEEIVRMNEAQRIMSERTLGDRIGDRVLSRLQEMCVVVDMTGEDYRQKVKRASFA